MGKYTVGIFTALILFYSTTSLSMTPMVRDGGFAGNGGVCRAPGDDTGCLVSMKNFIWNFVDEVGNTGTINLLEGNKVALTVNGINNGTWPVRLAGGASGYNCPQFTTESCTATLKFIVNVNGENILMNIFEHGGCTAFTSSPCGFIQVTIRGWTYEYDFDDIFY